MTYKLNDINEIKFTVNGLCLDPSIMALSIAEPDGINNIEVIVPNKVVKVTFNDGVSEKMVVKEPDVFSLESALYMAYAKRLYKKDYTFEYVEKMAIEKLPYMKYYIKKVKSGMKLYSEIVKRENELAEIDAIKERRKQKKIRYKANREERRKKEQISERRKLAKAIAKAMKEE